MDAALTAAEDRLRSLTAQVASLEAGGGDDGGASALRRELETLRASVSTLARGSPAPSAEEQRPAPSAEGCEPIAIDVVRLQDITRERFREEYQRRNRPVVLTDALSEWPASSKWSTDFFRTEYGEAEVEVSLDGAQGGVKKHCKLREYIDSFEQLQAAAAGGAEGDDGTSTDEQYLPYLRAWQYEEAHPELSKDFLVPGGWLRKYFPDKLQQLPQHIRPPLTFIFIGPKGACSKLHCDVWHTSAWLAQLRKLAPRNLCNPPEHVPAPLPALVPDTHAVLLLAWFGTACGGDGRGSQALHVLPPRAHAASAQRDAWMGGPFEGRCCAQDHAQVLPCSAAFHRDNRTG